MRPPVVRPRYRARLFEWAADPDRGGLLPDGFRNPFRRPGQSRAALRGDPLAAPDVTPAMASDFLRACDPINCGCSCPCCCSACAAEPCFLFVEYLDEDWRRVPCNPDLAYSTKGRRDKRFPLIEELRPFWDALRAGRESGLLYERRAVIAGTEKAPRRGAALADLVEEFRRRCGGPVANGGGSAALRDALLREAGGITYDQVEGEFGGLARRLRWPAAATPKDFRHLFCTMLGDAALPEGYVRYLMGHAPGKAAVVAYTHLAELPRHYAAAVRREWSPLVEAVLERLETLRPT